MKPEQSMWAAKSSATFGKKRGIDMSRVGKQPISIPSGVTVDVSAGVVTVKGAKGEDTYAAPSCIKIVVEDNQVSVIAADASKHARAMHGTVRSIINNMVVGVSTGYKKELLIEGVGYKAEMKGAKQIQLSLGFSHDILYDIPEGVNIEVVGSTGVNVVGINKQQVGQVAARIRDYSPAEPYKGKGVRYKGEQIRRKEGKAVA
jgi:large subunit ribosomal protein L6